MFNINDVNSGVQSYCFQQYKYKALNIYIYICKDLDHVDQYNVDSAVLQRTSVNGNKKKSLVTPIKILIVSCRILLTNFLLYNNHPQKYYSTVCARLPDGQYDTVWHNFSKSLGYECDWNWKL